MTPNSLTERLFFMLSENHWLLCSTLAWSTACFPFFPSHLAHLDFFSTILVFAFWLAGSRSRRPRTAYQSLHADHCGAHRSQGSVLRGTTELAALLKEAIDDEDA